MPAEAAVVATVLPFNSAISFDLYKKSTENFSAFLLK
jgi:hypothetical protein